MLSTHTNVRFSKDIKTPRSGSVRGMRVVACATGICQHRRTYACYVKLSRLGPNSFNCRRKYYEKTKEAWQSGTGTGFSRSRLLYFPLSARSFIHSFIHPVIHSSLIYSVINSSLIHSSIYSVIHSSFIYSVINSSFIYSVIHLFSH